MHGYRVGWIGIGMALALHADGLSDLRQALVGLPGQAAVKGTLEVKTWKRNGEGREATGLASVWVEDGPSGLRMAWGRDLLQRLNLEAQAKKRAAETPTPCSLGMEAMEPKEVVDQLNAAAVLSRTLEGAKLKSEGMETWNGAPARVLSLDLPLTGMTEKERKMIKEFQGTGKVWLGADGLPLAASTQVKVKGRALMVISFTQELEEHYTFSRSGDRLVCTQQESKQSGSGGGESGASRVVRTFRIQ